MPRTNELKYVEGIGQQGLSLLISAVVDQVSKKYSYGDVKLEQYVQSSTNSCRCYLR